MTIDASTIVFTIFGILLSIISYFLLNVHNDFKENKKDFLDYRQKVIEDVGKLKGQLELAQQEQRMRYEKIEQSTQQEIKHLAVEVTRLANTLDKFIKYNIEER